MSNSPIIDNVVTAVSATATPASGTWANTDERAPFANTHDPETEGTHACSAEPGGTPPPRSEDAIDDPEELLGGCVVVAVALLLLGGSVVVAVAMLLLRARNLFRVTKGYCDLNLKGIVKECGCKLITFIETCPDLDS